MRPLLRVSLLALSPFIAMNASAKSADRGLTALDLVQLERVSDPQLAPDGARVSYTLRQTDYAANKATRSLWVLDITTRETRRLTAPGSNASDARWAANGDLYFLSSRSGSQQVWRLPAAGGEAQPVTELALDVGSYTLSSDGSRIAFSLEVYPDCDSIACSKKRMDEEAARKTTGRSHEQLFIRHWDSWKDGRRNQLFAARLKDGRVQGEPVWVSRGLDGDVPSKPFGDASEYRFSPDGQQLAFTARVAGKSEAWSTNLDLWLVPSDGKTKPRKLTTGNEATDTGPVFSADGRTLYYRAMKRPGFEADRYALMALALKGGTPREIAPDWDRSANSLTLSADGKTIYTHADDLGQSRLFAVDIASGKVSALTGKGSLSGYSVAAGRIVYSQHSLQSPDQLYLLNADGSATQLTQHNADKLAGVRLGEAEQFSFAGWNNETVYGYVVKPWNYQKGRKYPVAFIIHGGPQGSMGNDWHYRWNPQTYAGQGYAVVFIDFHGSTGYGQKFTDSISGDWGGKPLEDLQKGWAHALKTYDFLDGTRAAALGASYGGYMINWIAGQWPDAFKALVNHCGIFDNRSMGYTTEELWFDEWELGGTPYDAPENYEKHNPVNLVKNWKTPMLVIHGEKDYRVPLEQGIATFTALQRRGIPSQFLHFPDENHWVLKPQNSVQWHEAVNAWLKRWIGN